ncbi:hypothetical protein [Cryobacterium sp.]|jgi:hypothetical protein|uniref:hypothetical protein n=1 Tax=Cryobacterium sp. TaxID=1926290 RepID=UPI00260263FF|nr:hypothetical protein [Cryobacterium sp.]MCU1446055.1 hypothetical protein [Cryobacterium sp.]
MIQDSELLFSLDVAGADAPRQAQRLTDWLVANGWASDSFEPGPRAFATGAVTEQQGGRLRVIAGPTMNMQGVDMDGPLCPHCETQVDIMELAAEISDDDPYPVVRCEACGRDVR